MEGKALGEAMLYVMSSTAVNVSHLDGPHTAYRMTRSASQYHRPTFTGDATVYNPTSTTLSSLNTSVWMISQELNIMEYFW